VSKEEIVEASNSGCKYGFALAFTKLLAAEIIECIHTSEQVKGVLGFLLALAILVILYPKCGYGMLKFFLRIPDGPSRKELQMFSIAMPFGFFVHFLTLFLLLWIAFWLETYMKKLGL
jgi:hypothetical protein